MARNLHEKQRTRYFFSSTSVTDHWEWTSRHLFVHQYNLHDINEKLQFRQLNIYIKHNFLVIVLAYTATYMLSFSNLRSMASDLGTILQNIHLIFKEKDLFCKTI